MNEKASYGVKLGEKTFLLCVFSGDSIMTSFSDFLRVVG